MNLEKLPGESRNDWLKRTFKVPWGDHAEFEEELASR